MKNYLERFNAMNDELKANPLVSIQTFEINEGISEANIKMVEKEVGITIAKSLREFYRSVGSLEFLWTLREDSKITLLDNDDFGNVNGKAYVPDLYTMVDGIDDDDGENAWKNIFWFPETMDKATLEENRRIRPFDFYDNHKGECVCTLKDETNYLKGELYVRTGQGKLLHTDFDVEKYIDLMINTRGFVNFQIAYLSKKSPERDKLKYYLQKIFPEITLEEFM